MSEFDYLKSSFFDKQFDKFIKSQTGDILKKTKDEQIKAFMLSEYSLKFPYYCCVHPELLADEIVSGPCAIASYKSDRVSTTETCQTYMENVYCKQNPTDNICSCMPEYKIRNPEQKALYEFLQRSDVASDIRKQCISTECMNNGWVPEKDRGVNICGGVCGNILAVSSTGGIINVDDIDMKVTCDPSSYDHVSVLKQDKYTYDKDQKTCVKSSNGNYNSLKECQKDHEKPEQDKYKFDKDQKICVTSSDGIYNSLKECQKDHENSNKKLYIGIFCLILVFFCLIYLIFKEKNAK
jgi:hypothetical protein